MAMSHGLRDATGKEPSASSSVSSFRIRTVADFQATPRKRRAGASSLACRMCRTRKLKCVTDNSDDTGNAAMPQRSCLPCARSRSECCWDREDRRKRPRMATSAPAPPAGPTTTMSGHGLDRSSTIAGVEEAADSGDVGGDTPAVAAPARRCSNAQPDLSSALVPFALSAHLENPSGSPHMNDAAPVPPNAQAQSITAEPSGAYSQDISWWPARAPIGSDEWSSLDEFVLGLDFANEMDDDWFSTSAIGAKSLDQDSVARSKHLFSRAIRLRYYRSFGPTAMRPGLRALSVTVEANDANQAAGCQAEGYPGSDHGSGHSDSQGLAQSERMAASQTSLIHDDVRTASILQTFFATFGGHFPFLHPNVLGGHVKCGEASSFLLNAVAALTLRFCIFDETDFPASESRGHAWQRGRKYLERAKASLVSVLNIPTPEVVAGLLILAWTEFGDNNETGMWMFTGMTIRMAQDLGLHKLADNDHDDSTASFHDHACPLPEGLHTMTDEQSLIHQQKARLVMFWSVFMLDVCVSLRMGRPPAIQQRDIEVPIPTTADMKITQLDFTEHPQTKNLIFPSMCGLMLLYAEGLEVLNTTLRGPHVKEFQKERCHRLTDVHDRMTNAYTELPSSLHLTAETYADASSSTQSGLLLTLHLYFYTLTTLITASMTDVSREAPSHDFNSNEMSSGAWSHPSQHLNNLLAYQSDSAMLATQKIVQALAMADLLDPNGYIASPFTNHALFLAASIALRIWQQQKERGTHTSTSPDPKLQTSFREPEECFARPPGQNHDSRRFRIKSHELSATLAKADYFFLRDKLKKQAVYFAAIDATIASLDRSEHGQTEDDPSQETVVDVDDAGIVSRYRIPQ